MTKKREKDILLKSRGGSGICTHNSRIFRGIRSVGRAAYKTEQKLKSLWDSIINRFYQYWGCNKHVIVNLYLRKVDSGYFHKQWVTDGQSSRFQAELLYHKPTIRMNLSKKDYEEPEHTVRTRGEVN
jgi:hypothetical protein